MIKSAKPFACLSLNLDTRLLMAALPMLQESKVGAIEWSFDALFKNTILPDWFENLLLEVGEQNRLIGHGIYYSIFNGKFSNNHIQWLEHLKGVSKKFKFAHITEHFGFLSGTDFHKGAPISVPFNTTTLALAQDRLIRLQDACQCPVGIENLAFAFCVDDVKKHGEFLEKLVEPINGFIILDLHNLYCQIENFKISFDELIQLYPLYLVREIHISGGSWDVFQTKKIRRDTHDEAVPREVFDHLKKVIPLCSNLKFVTLEHMGTALIEPNNILKYQQDFESMSDIINDVEQKTNIQNQFLPSGNIVSTIPMESNQLYNEQMVLSEILENAKDIHEAKNRLMNSILQHSDWQIQQWPDEMLYTAMSIAQKWKKGF